MSKQILKLTLIFTLFLIFTAKAQAYTPPIGIPDPGMWGSTHPIDSVAPATSEKCPDWPAAATVGCYYIDNTSASSTDTNNTYGYPNKPRKTVVGVLGAGAYVSIHGGPYTSSNGSVYWALAGTETDPIWITGDAVMRYIINLRSSSYVFIDGLTWDYGNINTWAAGALIIQGAHHVSFRNNIIRNVVWSGNSSGIGSAPYDAYGGRSDNIVVYNNVFSNLGNWQDLVDHDTHGIQPHGNSAQNNPAYNWWILNNSCSYIGGNCVQVTSETKSDNAEYCNHIYVGKNIAHHGRQTGFWSKAAKDVIISQNASYSNRSHGSQPGDGIGYQYGPENIWIMFNDIYDCNFGIRQSDTSSTTSLPHEAFIIGNKIHNIHPEAGASYSPTDAWRMGQAMTFWQGNMKRYVINNTIYDVHGGINSIQAGPLHIYNNIISDIDSQDYHLSIHQNNDQDTDADYNLFYDAADDARFSWASVARIGLPAFQMATGECVNCVVGDPKFINAAGGDFSIQASSVAINAGVVSDVYAKFKALYGIDISVDANNAIRPQGSGWDIGAHEYIEQLVQLDMQAPGTPNGISVI